jgi:diguanylate cyclase (GGDEF)-like protein
VSASGRTVLIAESDPELSLMLLKALRMEGLSAEACSDGIEAIRRAHSLLPDLFVCGLYLPGLGGMRVLRYLRSEPAFSSVPVIILAPRLDRPVLQRARRAGADMVLELPLKASEISSRCADLLGQKPVHESLSSLPGAPPDRMAILEELAGVLERRLDRLEAIRDLAVELSESPSVREIFRTLAAGVVAGLGFDRVQVFRYVPAADELRSEAALGRGLASDSSDSVMHLAEAEGLPAFVAIRQLRQVCSWELGLPEVKIVWAGSSRYVDTPLSSGQRAIGLVRCDLVSSGRAFAADDLESLTHLLVQASVTLSNAIDIEEISESREQMAAVLSSLDSAVVVVDSTLRIAEATSRTRDLFGVSPEAIKGRLLSEAIPLLARDSRPEMLRKVFLEGSSGLEQGVAVPLAGHHGMVLNLRFVPFRRSGRISGAVVLATDMTEEHTLREDLRRRNEELETLSSIGRELNSSLDIDELPNHLADALQQLYPEESIAILLPPEDYESSIPELLTVQASRGYPDDSAMLGREALPLGTPMVQDGEARHSESRPLRSSVVGVVANAVLGRKPINIPDVTQDARYVENLDSTRSELAVPMVVGERVIGVIDLQSPMKNRFSPDAVRRVSTLANHAATAIENARLHSRVWEMAQRDRLTGMRNLRYFEDRLKEELERASRYSHNCSLVMIDIDDFKKYNDAFGHPMGNLLLRTVTRAITGSLRDYIDTAVRYGGEEFVCILPVVVSHEAAEVAERIRRKVLDANVDIPHSSQQPLGCVSVSLGVSTFPTDVPDRDKLLEVADARMYMAKRAGKNRVCAPSLGNCPYGR